MATRGMAVAVALVAVWGAPAGAQGLPDTPAAVRIDDWEVADRMEQVQRALDRFIDGLRPPARAALAGEAGREAEISADLDGLRVSAGRMRLAYRPPGRTASAEVARLLARAKGLDSRLTFGGDTRQSQARWAAVVQGLEALGDAYHIDWQAPPGAWVPRRVCDRELRTAAVSLRAAVRDLDEGLRSILEKDKVTDNTEKARASRQVSALSAAVNDLLKAFERGDDPAVPVERASAAAAGLKPFMETYAGAAPLESPWRGANASLETITKAFIRLR